MADQLLGDLIKAVDAAAATFDGRGSLLRERELEMAIEAGLLALGRRPRRQHQFSLGRAWSGRVGGVDLALDFEGGAVLIELKWDSETLAACAWDQVKLAAALEAGEGTRAFLITGSPVTTDLRGDELLEDAGVEPSALRDRYAAEFDYWKGDVMNCPRLIPAGWQIHLHHTATLMYKGERWRIRLASLELTSTALVPFAR